MHHYTRVDRIYTPMIQSLALNIHRQVTKQTQPCSEKGLWPGQPAIAITTANASCGGSARVLEIPGRLMWDNDGAHGGWVHRWHAESGLAATIVIAGGLCRTRH